MFKLSNSNAIFVNKKLGKAYWKDKNPSGNEKEYILSDVLEALKFVLHNSYVQFAGYIFLQILGIPMAQWYKAIKRIANNTPLRFLVK